MSFHPEKEPDDCEAARLGHVYQTLYERHTRCDHAIISTRATDKSSAALDSIFYDIADRMDIIEGAATLVPARSMTGVLFLLVVASAKTGEIELRSPADSNLVNQIDRLLWSIRHFIELETGLSANSVGAKNTMPERKDPWRMEERLDALLSEEAANV